MKNNLFYGSSGIDIKIILIVFVVVLVLLIVFHLLFSKSRFNSAKKKDEKKIDRVLEENKKNDEDDENQHSKRIEKLFYLIKNSKRYDGSYSSLSGSAKKQIKKYMFDWMKNVPEYITISRKLNNAKYERLFILVSDSYDSDRYLYRWMYNSKKNVKHNFKNLVKMLNKFKVSYATIDLVSRIYPEQKRFNNKEYNQSNEFVTYSTTENNLFVKYQISNKKRI